MSVRTLLSAAATPSLLLFSLVACGGPLDAEPLEMGAEPVPEATVEAAGSDGLGTLESGLTASQKVTAGVCLTTSTLERSGTSLIATCKSRCEKESTVMGRMRVNRIASNGSVTLVGFNYFGASARTGGSTTLTLQNMPTARYESRCEADHSDKNRWHTFGTVVAGPATL